MFDDAMERIDLSQPSPERNVSFEVEDEKLWVSRETLALYSPYFKTMFYGDFRESQEQSIPLPGKKVSEIRELLLVLTPPILKPVDDENVDLLLDLAREYSISSLTHRCNEFLLKALRETIPSGERHLDILVLACKYDMFELMEQCIPQVAKLPVEMIDAREAEIPAGILAALYRAKLSKWKRHCRHELTGPPAPRSSRPQPMPMTVSANQAQLWMANQEVSYFCSSCNTNFYALTRSSCRFCKVAICDECVRYRPCPKSIEHGDTCECECEYNRNLLRRGNN